MCSYACADNVLDVVPAQPCTSTAGLLQRMDGLTATCCPDGSCDASLPTACDFSCELAVLAFVADCQTFFGIEQLEPIMQPVMELCEAVAPETDQTEIGGNAVDHFALGGLMGCTNLAHNRPATQSTTGYNGDAGRAVDGNGLDGQWGSASCTHTGTPLRDCHGGYDASNPTNGWTPPPDPPFPDCPTGPPPWDPATLQASVGHHWDGSTETSAEYLHRCLGGPPAPAPHYAPPPTADNIRRTCGEKEPTW